MFKLFDRKFINDVRKSKSSELSRGRLISDNTHGMTGIHQNLSTLVKRLQPIAKTSPAIKTFLDKVTLLQSITSDASDLADPKVHSSIEKIVEAYEACENELSPGFGALLWQVLAWFASCCEKTSGYTQSWRGWLRENADLHTNFAKLQNLDFGAQDFAFSLQPELRPFPENASITAGM